ncbi:hypothetical protein THAOC_12102, partial [Thalassiosira oceanica]
ANNMELHELHAEGDGSELVSIQPTKQPQFEDTQSAGIGSKPPAMLPQTTVGPEPVFSELQTRPTTQKTGKTIVGKLRSKTCCAHAKTRMPNLFCDLRKAITLHGNGETNLPIGKKWFAFHLKTTCRYDRNKLAAPENMDFTKVQRVNFAFFQNDEEGNIWGTDSWAVSSKVNVLRSPRDLTLASPVGPQSSVWSL